LAHCYSSANSKNARDFLINKVLKQFPFKVKSIQVDGGSEFRKHFEEACKELNIELLPPYSPKWKRRKK
jgi:IS30 family transposase